MTVPARVASAPCLVESRGLSVQRDGRVLVRDLEFSIPRGQFVAVVGPSGAGKSSLLACLAGMLEPGAGSVHYHDTAPRTPVEFRSDLGLVFQHLRLVPNASAQTNVLCGLLGRRPWWRTLLGFRPADKIRAREFLAQFELERHEHKPVAHLSGGERQRVAIARALMTSPAVILADEPVASLDDRLARNVLAALRDETRRRDCVVFCVLHAANYVAEFADLVLTLRKDASASWVMEPRAS